MSGFGNVAPWSCMCGGSTRVVRTPRGLYYTQCTVCDNQGLKMANAGMAVANWNVNKCSVPPAFEPPLDEEQLKVLIKSLYKIYQHIRERIRRNKADRLYRRKQYVRIYEKEFGRRGRKIEDNRLYAQKWAAAAELRRARHWLTQICGPDTNAIPR